MATDVEKVIDASETLRVAIQGRYLDLIADFCSTKYEWEFAKIVAILEQAIVQGSMITAIKNNKLSYRIASKLECDHSRKDTQTDFREHQDDMDSIYELERLQNEFEEYKRFSHGEVLALKAAIASRPNSPTIPPRQNPPDDMLKEVLLRSLKERITSLERQLHDKQKIIEKLLDGPMLLALTTQVPPTKYPIGKRVATKKLTTKNDPMSVMED